MRRGSECRSVFTSATVAAIVFACASAAPPPSAPARAAAGKQSESDSDARCDWARGWAARARGGRGGHIVRVTSLAASGPGTLAEALARSGPRLIVFEVGGVIDLAKDPLKIREPFVTVAGQTAPPPGITLIRGGIRVESHDVVIQHLRVRPGEAGEAKGSGWEPDGVATGSGARDVVVDHCSLTWAVDENLSASGERFRGATPDEWRAGTTQRVTFSHNLVAEGLSDSTHRKGEHSKGSLIHDNVGGALIYANLYASNVERNPFFKGGARGAVVNNFIANPGRYAMKYTLVAKEWGEHEHQLGQMAVVGNVMRYGPDTAAGVTLLFSSGPGAVEVYASDNDARDRAGAAVPLLGGALENFRALERAPLWPEGFAAMPASAVADYLGATVGARPWDRDAVDRRIVEQALAGGGAIIDSEQEVGGYPALEPTRRSFDPEQWTLPCLERRSATETETLP